VTASSDEPFSRNIENLRPGERLGPEQRRRLGLWLRDLRGKTTLEELGSRAGMAASSLSKLESGGSDPRLGSLLRLQRALGLASIEELLGPMPEPGEMPSAILWRPPTPSEPAAEAS
jgi:transcriptional regulator with XRE-family HTH domain